MQLATKLSPENATSSLDSGLISAAQLTRQDILDLFKQALAFELNARTLVGRSPFERKILATLFFEQSTRTRLSFESAMLRIGGKILPVNPELTRIRNNECLRDTVEAISSYCDLLVVRHPSNGICDEISSYADIPVINGGDGTNEHPSQALLDLYTVYREFGRIDGLHFTFVNDLRFARSVHSLLLALNNFDVGISFCAHSENSLPQEFQSRLKSPPILLDSQEYSQSDVVYVHPSPEKWLAPEQREQSMDFTPVIVDSAALQTLKPNAIVLHPGSRGVELPDQVAYSSACRMKHQALNGEFTRMALLSRLLSS
ncbi:MAG: hypothetical protein EBZ48_10445 [Proteobacteria bacterium]|nr:hypothetical protein [Pseudomonadota bacterium]